MFQFIDCDVQVFELYKKVLDNPGSCLKQTIIVYYIPFIHYNLL